MQVQTLKLSTRIPVKVLVAVFNFLPAPEPADAGLDWHSAGLRLCALPHPWDVRNISWRAKPLCIARPASRKYCVHKPPDLHEATADRA